jgi:hypothetical protein
MPGLNDNSEDMGDGRLRLADFGNSPQAAMRALLEEFASRGWTSSSTDAAVRIVRLLGDGALEGVSSSRVAHAAGRDFLTRNELTERSLKDALDRLAVRPKI